MEQYLKNIDTSTFEITTRQRYTKFSKLFFKNDKYLIIPNDIVKKFIELPEFIIACLHDENVVYISKYYNTSFIIANHLDIVIMKHQLYTLLMKYNMEDLSEYIKIDDYIFSVDNMSDIKFISAQARKHVENPNGVFKFESIISGKFSIYESIEELPNLDKYFKKKSSCSIS